MCSMIYQINDDAIIMQIHSKHIKYDKSKWDGLITKYILINLAL